MTIRAIFPWCFTPELYAERPDYIESLAAFVRSRPPQSVPDFLQQSDAVLAHDVEAHLGRILAPTHITVGTRDQLTSTRFADQLKRGIPNSELLVFDGCAHAAHVRARRGIQSADSGVSAALRRSGGRLETGNTRRPACFPTAVLARLGRAGVTRASAVIVARWTWLYWSVRLRVNRDKC